MEQGGPNQNRARWKEAIVVTLVAIYTVAFFWTATLFFHGQQEFTVSAGSGIAIAGIVWVALVALSSAWAIDKTIVFFSIAAIPAIVLLLVGEFSLAAIVGAAILFMLTISSQQSIAHELKSHVKIRVPTIFSFGVKTLLFGMLVAFVVFAIPTVKQAVAEGGIAVPQSYIRGVSNSVASVVRQDPAIIEQTIAQYIQSRAQQSGLEVTVIIIAVALLAVRTLVPVISWPTMALVSLLFWIAKKCKLFTIVKKEVSVEVLEM